MYIPIESTIIEGEINSKQQAWKYFLTESWAKDMPGKEYYVQEDIEDIT